MEAIEGIESTYKNRGKCVGLPTMTTDFDRMTGGLRPGQMVVVAGRPGMGKSALSVQWATAMAEAGFPVAVFSLEMTGVDLASRMICTEMPLDLKRVRDGFMNKNDMQRMPVAASKIGHLPLHIDETPSLNIFDFRGRARRAVVKHGVKCIVVDYLQLMRSTSKRAQENRAYEVAEISMALKATAKELGVPVIAATQLGRNAEERSAPKLADLRESGQIEQDADIVVMLHRPKKGMKDSDGNSLDDGSVELIVAKQRNGPVGTVNLKFEAEYTRFANVTEALYSNNKEKRQKN
jgi:replicative DNA helicase